MHGYGIYKDNRSGDIYEGQFRYGLKNGNGVLKYYTGDVYEGRFRNNVIYGDGVLRYKNGNIGISKTLRNGKTYINNL